MSDDPLEHHYGLVEVDLQMLDALLLLPEGHCALDADVVLTDFGRRVLRVQIEGPNLPETPEGQPLPRVIIKYRRGEDGGIHFAGFD